MPPIVGSILREPALDERTESEYWEREREREIESREWRDPTRVVPGLFQGCPGLSRVVPMKQMLSNEYIC